MTLDRAPFEIAMRHPSRNALTENLIEWLTGELDQAHGRPLLLSGTPEAFCAGLDLKYVASLDIVGMQSFLESIDSLVRKLYEHPAPTVACIEGHAIAGGSVLALACDHAVVSDDERLRVGLNEVALGACFPPGILKMLRRRLSSEHHERVLLGAELHAPRAALALGLVGEVAGDAATVARERLARFTQHPAATYSHTKRALRAGVMEVAASEQRRFIEEEVPIWTSPEVKERVRAVLER